MGTIKDQIKKVLCVNANEDARNTWLINKLSSLPAGIRLLDAGAGELRNKKNCTHLNYVSQDFCQYEGQGNRAGLQTGSWDTSQIDIVCDIVDIPEPNASFDAILCSEVFEHLPAPHLALSEFIRLLKPGGILILTAPFSSLVHFAPYHYATGFSRYWYEHYLPLNSFEINELTPNGDWFNLFYQELLRWPGMVRKVNPFFFPLVCLVTAIMIACFFVARRGNNSSELACFGWHCTATRK